MWDPITNKDQEIFDKGVNIKVMTHSEEQRGQTRHKKTRIDSGVPEENAVSSSCEKLAMLFMSNLVHVLENGHQGRKFVFFFNLERFLLYLSTKYADAHVTLRGMVVTWMQHTHD